MLIAGDIVKNYKSQEVLRGVSLTINDGEFVSIMGESGSGKSTLLAILAGNMKADSGSVIIDGEDIAGFNEDRLALVRREKLGFVYHHTTEGIEVSLLGEIRTGHVMLLTREDWEKGIENG